MRNGTFLYKCAEALDRASDALDNAFGIPKSFETNAQKKNRDLSDDIIARLALLESTKQKITFLLAKAADPAILSNPTVHHEVLTSAQQYINTLTIKSAERKNFQNDLDRIKFSRCLLKERTAKQLEIESAHTQFVESAYKQFVLTLSSEKERSKNPDYVRWLATLHNEIQLHFLNQQSRNEDFDVADFDADSVVSTSRESVFAAFFRDELAGRAAIQSEFTSSLSELKKNESDCRINAEFHYASTTNLTRN